MIEGLGAIEGGVRMVVFSVCIIRRHVPTQMTKMITKAVVLRHNTHLNSQECLRAITTIDAIAN